MPRGLISTIERLHAAWSDRQHADTEVRSAVMDLLTWAVAEIQTMTEQVQQLEARIKTLEEAYATDTVEESQEQHTTTILPIAIPAVVPRSDAD